MDHPDVPVEVVNAAIAASPMLERFYLEGGGSPQDFRTDVSAALAAVRYVAVPVDHGLAKVIDLVDRRTTDQPFAGPDRRQRNVATQ